MDLRLQILHIRSFHSENVDRNQVRNDIYCSSYKFLVYGSFRDIQKYFD